MSSGRIQQPHITKPSIFRTISQLVSSSSSIHSSSNFVQTSEQRFNSGSNFFTSTPKANTKHRSSPLSNSSAQPFNLDFEPQVIDQTQAYYTPFDNLSEKQKKLLRSLDTPPYTPLNVIRPIPHRLFPVPHLDISNTGGLSVPHRENLSNDYQKNMSYENVEKIKN